MSRRHDYDEQEGCDRRIPSDRRNPGESRYLDDPRYGTDRREQPIIRDLRDRRFPLERRDYADSREQEEGGEIRIARGVRESRYPGYRRETLTPRDTRSLDDTGPTERIYQRRAPRELVASEDPRHAREYHRNAGGVRYSQDPRRIRDETNDPRLLRRRRENSDDTRIPYEREYQRTDQPTSRSNFIEQSQSQWDNVRDSSRSDVDIRGQEYFLPAAGISRAVIEADLRLYLGPNATCRPVTNREGVRGYLIRASRPIPSDMISNLKADSQRLEHESRWGGQETMRDTRSHRPTVGSDPENTELIPRRMVSEDSRVGEDLHLIRQQAVTDYPRRHLFDHSERVHAIAVPHTVGPDRERSHSRIDRFMVRDTTGHGGSIFSQSSTYENPSTGSRATQWSSRSSYSTAPSSLQSMSDERGRFQGQEVIQYPVGRGSMSQYGGSFQDTPPAPQSYTDPRTGERVVISARRGATQRSATGPTMEPDDDPPDWDKTPNFGEFGRGP